MNWFFLTVGYSGLSPKAPGTVGTLVSLPLGVLILMYLGPQTLFLAAILITLIAIKQINRFEADTHSHDDKRIVIDELVGIWLALSIAPGVMFATGDLGVWNNGIALQIVLSFLFFRFYDIKKPSVIGRIDREAQGGIGVMGDDIIAGFAAGISSAILWQVILKSGLIH
ncbi:MAG: phosphatidylglycerophosphatase A [Sulfuricurvum sp.]|jgi:phosphatidylglycerophosphatase A|uniref:phosphatidylglycerophosphatase A family protein n=1 Tax=Sulfuricurvum sp. TaxID=2025608 RepID=UPI0025FF268E|nr:phosphatidylglycerophosphatase A [Sulfuricurvum sp.]MCK9372873.1 phosphatidylglycerophosphatase A [Sulfuricurvum sp.]